MFACGSVLRESLAAILACLLLLSSGSGLSACIAACGLLAIVSATICDPSAGTLLRAASVTAASRWLPALRRLASSHLATATIHRPSAGAAHSAALRPLTTAAHLTTAALLGSAIGCLALPVAVLVGPARSRAGLSGTSLLLLYADDYREGWRCCQGEQGEAAEEESVLHGYLQFVEVVFTNFQELIRDWINFKLSNEHFHKNFFWTIRTDSDRE